MKADKKTIESYNRTAKYYGDSRTPTFWNKEIRYFLDLLPENSRVLDVGCGSGRDTKIFLRNDVGYVGLDASEKMIEYAKSKNPTAKYEIGDFYNLNLSDNFNGFWAAASIFHARKGDLQRILGSLYGLLLKGGVGFISIIVSQGSEEIYERTERFGVEEIRFKAFYETDEFKQCLVNAKFQVINYWEKGEKDKVWGCYFVKK